MGCNKNVLNRPCSNSVTGDITGNVTGDLFGNVYTDYISELISGAGITFESNIDFASGISIDFSGTNVSGLSSTLSGIADNTYYLPEISISGSQITGITSHRDANNNVFIATDSSAIFQSGSGQIVIGNNAETHVSDSIAIGTNAKNYAGGFSLCIGRGALVSASNSIAIGNDTVALATLSTVIGANCENHSEAVESLVAGVDNINNGRYSVVLGDNNVVSSSAGENQVLGSNNQVYGKNCICIGKNQHIGNLTSEVLNSACFGYDVICNSNSQLVFGGANEFNNTFINNLASTTTTSGYATVLYDTSTKEVVYCPNNSGVKTAGGTLTISGTGTQFIPTSMDGVDFKPLKVEFDLDVGLSTGGAQNMHGVYTPDQQWCNSFYVQGATNVRGTNNSNCIALTTNGSTYSEVASITSTTVSGFAVNCTTFGTTRNYNYSVIG